MTDEKFKEKIRLICDPYFDREFFTNLIYCIDRKKTSREIFESVVAEVAGSTESSEAVDRGLMHLFYAYQAANVLRDNYQWLPIAQGIYSLSLFRSNGQKPLPISQWPQSKGYAATAKEFEELIGKDVRAVSSKESAYSALLFLLENRSSRSEAASQWIRQALFSSGRLTFGLVVKALDLCLASGWRSNAAILKRPFEKFWSETEVPEFLDRAARLSATGKLNLNSDVEMKWEVSWSEELWRRASLESAESAWEWIGSIVQQGATIEQIFSLLTLLRGRCLFHMKTEQWPIVMESVFYSDALHSASRWASSESSLILALNVLDFTKTAKLISTTSPQLPTGQSVLDGVSKNIAKDRLILRLDDCVERGLRHEALELMAVILQDQGLSHSLTDRLQLMAAKQDGWTYQLSTIPSAVILCKAFESCRRLQIRGPILLESIYGLLRFLSDQRETSLAIVPKTGTYGDGLSRSQYDVSGGARIVDRFVFNQLRNAQRVKIWPSNT